MPDEAEPEFTAPPIRVEPTPRRVTVKAGDTVLGRSDRAQLLVWFGPRKLPTYCLPPEDVRTDVLVPAARGRRRDEGTEHDVAVPGSPVIERGAFRFDGPEPPLDVLDGHWTFTWDQGLSWYEEATEVHVHARDPSKRVDVLASDRHVLVEVDGEVLAESRRAHALFETGLPTRWYFPPEDVRQELLVDSTAVTSCPYKGTARYWSVQVGDVVHVDLAWSYPDPIPECPHIAGLIAFFNERVDLTVDGELQARPQTPWSR